MIEAALPNRDATWQGEPTRLDRVLVAQGLVRSRTRAAQLITNGAVRVSGETVTKASFIVKPTNRITLDESDRWVSRGALKLLAAFEAFHVDPSDRLVLDLGASTGGFTQVALEAGARHVIALDVGHDQLDPQLREHPAVTVIEGCNARELDATGLAQRSGIDDQPTLVVADLSFISLTLILPAISRVLARPSLPEPASTAPSHPTSDVIVLIKPQFEVGRVKDGVVRDERLRRQAILEVLESARENGFMPRALRRSPIQGADGNVEVLAHLVPVLPDTAESATEWDAWINRVVV